VSETNKGKKSLLYDGYTFRVDAVLKNQEICWWCTNNSCKCRLRTDSDCRVIIKGKNEHNHLSDERKLERQQFRIKVKRKATDISARPSKVILQELQNTEESNLLPVHIRNLSQSVYRERRKEYPVLPKNRLEIHECLKYLTVGEDFFFYHSTILNLE